MTKQATADEPLPTGTDTDWSLVGKYCHSLLEKHGIEYCEWQGKIVGEIGTDYVLVQLFSWLDGSPTLKRLVPLFRLANWNLYDTAEAMNLAYRNVYEPRRKQIVELEKKAIRESDE